MEEAPESILVSEEESCEINERVISGLESAAKRVDSQQPHDVQEEIYAALWLAESVWDESQCKTPYAVMYELAVQLLRLSRRKGKK